MPPCQDCHRDFNTSEALKEHIKEHQSRISRAIKDVDSCQSRLASSIQALLLCMSHPDDFGHEKLDGSDTDVWLGNKGTIPCPSFDCDKGPFDRKSLQRHYDIHVHCDEICDFCGKHMDLVSQVKRHYSECQETRDRKNNGTFREIMKEARKRRENMSRAAASQLHSALNNSEQDALKNLTVASCANRKRGRQPEADSLPPAKRGRVVEGDSDEAPTEHASLQVDSGNVAGTSANNFDSPSVWSSLLDTLPFTSESTVPGSDSSHLLREHDLGPRGSDNAETFFPSAVSNSESAYANLSGTADQYETALPRSSFLSSAISLPRAPALSVHTVDGPAPYAATYISMQSANSLQRAPALSVHTVDGPALYPADFMSMQSGHSLQRAPTLSVHTVDGPTACQPVSQYPSSTHDRRSSASITTEHGTY
ncbi:hypothetical protein B0J13DRAFT_332756 [Dactylonectria estremocensis]|uniref:C2H2-type domain-containing protein n=1 Tax=Dactylonectria estremocensis TaxID=1079267 RepID=A0A9P9CX66_9HYPO|nr:hypothetical protein B0J13DRAFT_332756 [Dactylonectria estremocensis]